MKKSIVSLYFFLLLFLPVYATDDFINYEDSLRTIIEQVPFLENDSQRQQTGKQFKDYFQKVLSMEGSFDYPFDSLTVVSFLKAPDDKFRIISWYIPLEDDRFEYFGFFQIPIPEKEDEFVLFELKDVASELSQTQYEILKDLNWYGAYYLELIHRQHNREDYYALLGWRGDNPQTRKRVIEPLVLTDSGEPVFGQEVFTYRNNNHKRVIFEYSSRVSITMNYESQRVEGRRRPEKIIIFDRVAPTHSFLEGHYQYYVPETNIFDGFAFDDGKWVFIEDIDARVPPRTPPPLPQPPE